MTCHLTITKDVWDESIAATEIKQLNALRTRGDGVRQVARITRLEHPA